MTELPDVVTVSPWHVSVADCFDPRSEYVEHCWLPVLGPTATWLYRRLGTVANRRPNAEIDLLDLTLSIGLGPGLGNNGHLAQALKRLEGFTVIERSDSTVRVRAGLPVLDRRSINRLPLTARGVHNFLSAEPSAR